MNRYISIFLLNFQEIFTQRGRSLVGFLVTVLNPLVLLLFWLGAGKISSTFNQQSITAYYLLLVALSALLRTEVEEIVSETDIYEGHLSQYLLRPFSYYWFKLFEEIPYRLLQIAYGSLILSICLLVFKNIVISHDFVILFFATVILIFGFMLAFTFKMILGLLAFWVRETQAMYHVFDALLVICAGYLLPFNLMPDNLSAILRLLPFSFMGYTPVIAFEGKLSIERLLLTLALELFWLGIFYLIYRFVWSRGLRRYTALGQ